MGTNSCRGRVEQALVGRRPSGRFVRSIASLLLFVACLGSATTAPAQELEGGTPIRLHPVEGPSIVGTLDAIDGDSLWYTPRGRHASSAVALSTVARLDRRERNRRGRGALEWGLAGGAAGGIVGAGTCLADPESCTSRPDESEAGAALESAAFLGLGVGLLSSAVGAAFPGYRWVQVPQPYAPTRATRSEPADSPRGDASVPKGGTDALDRRGFWVGIGAGPAYSWINCSACGPPVGNDPWDGGRGGSLTINAGGTLRPSLLLGGEISVWGSTRSASGLSTREATVIAMTAVTQYYPWRERHWYLKGGVGIGGALLETSVAGTRATEEIDSSGLGLLAGVGFDIPLGRRLALSPSIAYVQTISDGPEATIGNERVVGPDNPGFVTLGVALMRY